MTEKLFLSLPLTKVDIHFGHVRMYAMGTNCAPLVADLFSYCYERDSMDSLNHDDQAATSMYLVGLLNIDNPYFEGLLNQIYPHELQLNKANTTYTEALPVGVTDYTSGAQWTCL